MGKPSRLENDLEMLVFHGVSISNSQISQRKLLSSGCFGPGNPRWFQVIQGDCDCPPGRESQRNKVNNCIELTMYINVYALHTLFFYIHTVT